MTTQVQIHDTKLPALEECGRRVVTLAMVDAVHKRPRNTARRAFNAIRHRLVEGEDFAKLSAYEFRTRFPGVIAARTTGDVTILFEGGYLLLVKSFNDDLAWSVQRQLVNSYFRTKEVQRPFSVQPGDTLTAEEQASLRDMLTSAVAQLPKAEQGKEMIKAWSRLKSHFKVPYRLIPRAEYTEALSIMARHTATFAALPAPAAAQAPEPSQVDHDANEMVRALTTTVVALAATVEALSRQAGRNASH